MPASKTPINVMVPRIYHDVRSAEIVEGFDRLRERGLVGKIVVLDSARDDSISCGIDLSQKVDVEVSRRDIGRKGGAHPRTLECGTDEPEGFREYCEDVALISQDNDVDLVMPTSEKGVLATSYSIPQEKRMSQDLEVVDLFQNKLETYSFMESNGFRAPASIAVNLDTMNTSEAHIQRFLERYNGLAFAKPSVPQIGGGVGASPVESFEQLEDLMRENAGFSDYLLSEHLYGPEINHTIVLNEDGSVSTQCSYQEIPKEVKDIRRRLTLQNERLDEFGKKFGAAVRSHFPEASIKGPYNVDFLRAKEGDDLVLSEVNPGRFPFFLGAFREDGYNLLESVVQSFSGETSEYQGRNTPGVVYSEPKFRASED